jgi:hypothetical protein
MAAREAACVEKGCDETAFTAGWAGVALSADVFVFPAGMPREEAERLLREAYGGIDEGKLLRRTNKELRRRGIDPPMDVQYVAEPAVQRFADGLGISLGCDIMIYEPFPEMDACTDAFEDMLNEILVKQLRKLSAKWLVSNRRDLGAG